MTTYYGHGSWIAAVVFFGLIMLRVFSSQRRRQGRQGPARARSFTESPPSGQGSEISDAGLGNVRFTGIAPGWLTDPSGRHEQRYWSGSQWTERVLDGGVPGTDPPPGDRGVPS